MCLMDVPTNFTAWGVKIVTPYDARNSDGIDPGYGTNVTITQSHISDGDDQVAIGGNKLPGASYYTRRRMTGSAMDMGCRLEATRWAVCGICWRRT